MSTLEHAAARLGLTTDQLIPYGRELAKLPLDLLESDRPRGKLILVSAMTPTPAGEGKTTTSIGLVQGLTRIGCRAAAALREPSLGPCFGVKGGGTGGGQSRLEPSVTINLHCTGDLHAVTSAHNLVAALLDKHLHFAQSPRIDPRAVMWQRVLDMNDRSLRNVMVGMAGEGLPRESGFDITAASEVMAVLCLASDEADLRARLSRMLVAFDMNKKPVTAADLGAVGAMVALLQDAMMPNLARTTEGSPALVHGGPFANIAHGCNSVIATRMALGLADWVVTEAGFGFDLGAEKFVHIKARANDLKPSAVVLVATVRALKWHGGAPKEALTTPDPGRVEAGLANLAHHIGSAKRLGLRPIVAINRFADDTDEELEVVRAGCAALGVTAVPSDHFARGGEGAEALARAVLAHAEEAEPQAPTYLYEPGDSIESKINAVARGIYGARGAVLSRKARMQLGRIERMGLDGLPVCMSKTPASLSDDGSLRNVPTGFDVQVRELQISAGAGFIVALMGSLVRMPGLGRKPQAERIDLVDGEIIGVG
jgi:formate--tetrahydrofolate ligase